MAEVFLSLGSNIGNRLDFLKAAIGELLKIDNTTILKVSSVYKTQPWGNPNQNEFLNCTVKIYTNLSPNELLDNLKTIEKYLGRKNIEKWSNREIDIDILFYDNLILSSENLIIPHPEIPNRRFVLIPLNEIEENYIHPILNKPISYLLKTTNDKLKCEYFKSAQTIIPFSNKNK